jgi:hypothetical protein
VVKGDAAKAADGARSIARVNIPIIEVVILFMSLPDSSLGFNVCVIVPLHRFYIALRYNPGFGKTVAEIGSLESRTAQDNL